MKQETQPVLAGHDAALQLQDISYTFARRKMVDHVLGNISLTVNKGEFVTMIGPSGCGKSTIFHIIGGLLTPARGAVWMNGRDVTGSKGNISYIPQNAALFPWRTILDNVILVQEVAGMPLQDAKEQARHWLAKVGLEGYEQAYPHVLSGGMQQRVAFIRALLSPQELMCLDEPFSALDALTRMDMQSWLLQMWEENKRSVLFVTHSIEEALLLSDTIYVLSQKPTTVVKRIEVPFQRPRNEEIVDDPVFLQLKREIYQSIRT